MTEDRSDPRSDENVEEEWDSASQEAEDSRASPDELRTVNVELVWARYERNRNGGLSPPPEMDDPTLSVCMVISWPPHALVDRAAEFPSSGETLHKLIEVFEYLRTKGSVVAAKSRIEDGQFVAWLSYPDVVTAADAFLSVRDKIQERGLIPKFKTRDIRVPLDCDDAQEAPVMAQTS